MATFLDITKQKFLNEQPRNVDILLIKDNIGEMDIAQITSKDISVALDILNDKYKITGTSLEVYKDYMYEVLKFAKQSGRISKVPETKNRSFPNPNLYNKPDPTAIEKALISEHLTPSATIVHLAWQAGLLREEIRLLKWDNIDFRHHQIILADRTIPLEKNLEYYLEQLYEDNNKYSDYVLITTRGKKGPWTKQSISNATKIFLKKVGQDNVRLNDLRSNYILCLLQKYDLDVVSYISGVNRVSINEHYLPYLNSDKIIKPEMSGMTAEKRKAIEDILSQGSIDNEVIAIRFIWKLGIQSKVIPLLKWNLIDFKNKTITFFDRTVHIDDDTLNLLKRVKKDREGRNTNILLRENSEQPLDRAFLEKAIRNKLVRNGIFGVSVGNLYYDYWFSNIDELVEIKSNIKRDLDSNNHMLYSVSDSLLNEHTFISSEILMSYINKNNFATAEKLISEFGMSESDAKLQLNYATIRRLLSKYGDRYYQCGYKLTQEVIRETIKEYFTTYQPMEISHIMLDVMNPKFIETFQLMLNNGDIVKTSEHDYAMKEYVEEMYMLPKLLDENREKITEYLKSNKIITACILSDKLNITDAQAEQLLSRLTKDNILEKYMGRYYLKGSVIEKNDRNKLILKFASKHQPFNVTQASDVIGLCNERIKHILDELVNAGELKKPLRNTYCIPQYLVKIESIEKLLSSDVGQKRLYKIAHVNILTANKLMTEFNLSKNETNILLKYLEDRKLVKRKDGENYTFIPKEKIIDEYLKENVLVTSYELKELFNYSDNGIHGYLQKLIEEGKITRLPKGIYCKIEMLAYINDKMQELLNHYGSKVMEYLNLYNSISNETIQEKFCLSKTESNILIAGLLQNSQVLRMKKDIYCSCENYNNKDTEIKNKKLIISAKRIGEILDVDHQLKHRIINELLNANKLTRVGKGTYSLAENVTVKDNTTVEKAVIKANNEVVEEKINLIRVYIIDNGVATSKEISNVFHLEIHYVYYILQLMQEKDIIYREKKGKYKLV